MPQLPLPVEVIERRIYLVRCHKVMLDSDLAELYAVTTFNLNKAVKRNLDRFPPDFMFQLAETECTSLIFQSGISKTQGRGGRRHLPYAFTEQGVAMLSSVLRSKRAVLVNIAIMRAFVKVREMVSAHKDLAQKLEELEKKYDKHDGQFRVVFDALKRLIETPPASHRKIGFLNLNK